MEAQMNRHSLHSYLKVSPSSEPAPSSIVMSVQLEAEGVWMLALVLEVVLVVVVVLPAARVV